jgi:hypothetical protein
MDADERRSRLDQITERIIGCVHQVSNVLGTGFLEKVQENALAVELGQAGIQAAQQYRIEVRYKGILVGDFSPTSWLRDVSSWRSRRSLPCTMFIPRIV